MNRLLLFLTCFTVMCSLGFAKPAHEMDLKDSHVEVPWNEFRTILDKTTKPVVQSARDTIYSPQEYLITAVNITGKIHDHSVARFKAECQVDIPYSRTMEKNGWIVLPLGSDKSGNVGAVLESAFLNGKSVPVETKGGINRILISKRGVHTVTLNYYVPVKSQEGTWSLNCGFPSAAAGNLTLVIPNARAEVKLNGIKRPVQGDGKNTVLSTPITLGSDVSIRYSLIGEEQGAVAGMTPKMFAETGLLVTIKENRIDYRYRVEYQIWHQKKKQFELLLPDSLPVEGVSGAGLAGWEVQQRDSGSVLVVKTGFVPDRDYTLTVEFSKRLETVESNVSIPKVKVLDVNRETGFIVVQAPKTMEVFPDTMNQLTEVAGQELPEWLKHQSDLLMRFKYTRDYTMGLSVRRHKDMPVLVAIADEATFSGIVTKDGYRLMKYRYFIRNNHKQYLALSMPEGWELWSALIDGEAVMPATSDDKGTVQIPLKKLSRIEEGSGFTLELVYWFEGEPMKRSGKIEMITPKVDINCQKLNGEIRVPSEYSYDGFKGSLKHIEQVVSNRYLSGGGFVSTRSDSNRDLRKSKRNQRYQSYQNFQMVQSKQVVQGNRSKAFSLPVEIDIPKVGKPLRFSRNLVIPGEKGEFSFSYGKAGKSVKPLFKWLLWFVTLLFSYFACTTIVQRKRDKQKIAIPIVIFLGGLFGISLINGFFQLNIHSIGQIVILGGMAALLTIVTQKSGKEVA